MSETELTPFRRKTLEHIRRLNDEAGSSARCPYGEMIAEANAAIRDGQSEWKADRFGLQGRWITDAGRSALAPTTQTEE